MVFKQLRSPFTAKSSLRRRSVRSSILRPQQVRQIASKVGKPCNIKVCVRVRPHNHAEQTTVSKTVVQPFDDRVLVFDPPENTEPSYFKGRIICDPTARRNKNLRFAFDRVFSFSDDNACVFSHTTQPILDTLMEGINCSVFAYGATGAGKTWTMLGKTHDPGIMTRTVQELYKLIEKCSEDTTCEIQISYLEVYNETVRDLLNEDLATKPLNILEDASEGIKIQGLSLHEPKDSGELFALLERGNLNRTQHPTDANAESSRSHAVCQVYVKQQPRTASSTWDCLVSKLTLVDLAGSERATVTTNRGARMREGANINRSLLALGNCINALAEGKRHGHVPFRDSKLTRILKDSLGGDCRTVMIAAVSPSSLSYEDTYNTLKYADRAKHIKAELKKNILHIDEHIHRYAAIIQQQKSEIDELRMKLAETRKENALLKEQLLRVAPAEQQLTLEPLTEPNGAPLVNGYDETRAPSPLEHSIASDTVPVFDTLEPAASESSLTAPPSFVTDPLSQKTPVDDSLFKRPLPPPPPLPPAKKRSVGAGTPAWSTFRNAPPTPPPRRRPAPPAVADELRRHGLPSFVEQFGKGGYPFVNPNRQPQARSRLNSHTSGVELRGEQENRSPINQQQPQQQRQLKSILRKTQSTANLRSPF